MSSSLWWELLTATWQTIYMVLISGLIAGIIGIPLGFILFITRKQQFLSMPVLHQSLGFLVNALRSIPFIILLIAIIPLTRLIVGTSIGTTAAIVPLALGAIPFIARIVENAIAEIDSGLIEAAQAMGSTHLQIIRYVLWPESLMSVISGFTVVLISLVGYSAMAGAIGGGGLGDFAIRYGYQQFDTTVMVITVVVLVILVQCMQWLGNGIVKSISHKES